MADPSPPQEKWILLEDPQKENSIAPMSLQEHPIFLVDTAGISMRFSDDVPGAREASGGKCRQVAVR